MLCRPFTHSDREEVSFGWRMEGAILCVAAMTIIVWLKWSDSLCYTFVMSYYQKFMRTCPSCDGGVEIGLDDDNLTVKSSRTIRSVSSHKSTKSLGMTKLSKSKPSESGRYGALPFNGDGYCCVHPSVQIALKKKTGGFKIIHDVCPECATAEGVGGGRASNSRRNKSVSREGRHRGASRHRRSRGDKNDKVKGSAPACVAKKRIAWADLVVSVSCI